MNKGYNICKLPVDSVGYDRKNRVSFIEGGTFPHIPMNLPIRPRALRFLFKTNLKNYQNPPYAVLYADDNKVQCLFLFQFVKANPKYFDMMRTVGKRRAREHWQKASSYIKNYTKEIQNLSESDVLEFK